MGAGFRPWLIVAAVALTLPSCRQAPAPDEQPARLSLPNGDADNYSDDRLTLVPPGFERAAAGLSYLFHVSGDIFGTVDPIDGDVVFLNGRGKQLGVARLPDGFIVRDIDIGPAVTLRGDDVAVVIPRSGAVRGQLAGVPLPRPSTSVVRNGRALEQSYAKAGGTATLHIAPRGKGRVLNTTFLGFDDAGNPYAYCEEGADRTIDAWVGRFGADGKLDAGGRLDLAAFEDMPAVPVAVTPSGVILMMQPTDDSIELVELTLVDGRAGNAVEKLIGTTPVNIMDVGTTKPDVVRVPYTPSRRPAPAYDPAFGAAALARARTFLEAEWALKPGNYLQPGIAHNCEPEQGQYWARPVRLNEGKVGKEVTALPYKWGGFDSVAQFKQRVDSARPALAGNVCTCREPAYGGCQVAKAAGVDCSGFVSRAWGLKAHNGTTVLARSAAELSNLFDLRPGDILNRPGSHVRLFVRFEPGPEVRIRTLESSVSCGGVCEKVYTPAQLMTYRPMRLLRGGRNAG